MSSSFWPLLSKRSAGITFPVSRVRNQVGQNRCSSVQALLPLLRRGLHGGSGSTCGPLRSKPEPARSSLSEIVRLLRWRPER
eukprot:5765762-Amphidinium_carterae.1